MGVWLGTYPNKCQLELEEITDEFVDGATRPNGRWAIMCPKCHTKYGVGLGTGRGQRFKKRSDGKFVKVEG